MWVLSVCAADYGKELIAVVIEEAAMNRLDDSHEQQKDAEASLQPAQSAQVTVSQSRLSTLSQRRPSAVVPIG